MIWRLACWLIGHHVPPFDLDARALRLPPSFRWYCEWCKREVRS